jgi:hypothetical protein
MSRKAGSSIYPRIICSLSAGGDGSGAQFVDERTPSIWIRAAIVAMAALVAHLIPRLRPSKEGLGPAVEKA